MDTITVIGLGPMGKAMTRALLEAGHRVTVWNRTASRAEEVLAAGAALAAAPAEAVRASDLTILSLTDYQAMYDILGGAAESLQNRVLVNLSSDTPDRSRAAARWAACHGAAFLTGGLMVPAPMIGTKDAYAYYSGPENVLDEHRAALSAISSIRYLGADPRLAQLMYQAQLDVFLTTLSGLMHATALLGKAGFPAARAVPDLLAMVASTAAILEAGDEVGLGARIDAGEHPGELSTVTMMGATAAHIRETSQTLGVESGLPAAVLSHYRRALDDGHGGDNWTRIIDGIRDPRA